MSFFAYPSSVNPLPHPHTQVIMLTFLYFLLWLLITVAVGGIMVYYVQAELKCGELEAMGRMNDSSACFPYVDRSMCIIAYLYHFLWCHCGLSLAPEVCAAASLPGLLLSCLLCSLFSVISHLLIYVIGCNRVTYPSSSYCLSHMTDWQIGYKLWSNWYWECAAYCCCKMTFLFLFVGFQYFAICGGNGLQELCTDVSVIKFHLRSS